MSDTSQTTDQPVRRHDMVSRVQLERRILDRMDYDGVVKLHFTFQDAISLYMGLEYCPNGELYDQIRLNGSLDESTARFYTAEIILMLEYLRHEGIAHRDIKPENLLVMADGHLKLIDFGSARDIAAVPPYFDTVVTTTEANTTAAADNSAEKKEGDSPSTTTTTTAAAAPSPSKAKHASGIPTAGLAKNKASKRANSLVGTADYVSPEVLANSHPPSYAMDLWALGCVLYQMLTGRPPFKAQSEYLTFQKITALEYTPLSDAYSEDVRDLVQKLLVLNPEERLGSRDINELKEHAFFKDIDWDNLRTSTAPEATARDNESIGSATSSFDWELQSLAAALPQIASGLKFRNSIEIPD